MSYTFHDDATNTDKKLDETRPVVVLWDLGDADLSTIINSSDATYVTSYIKETEMPGNGIDDENFLKLFLFRIMDADKSGIINSSDKTAITSHIKETAIIQPFYTTLK